MTEKEIVKLENHYKDVSEMKFTKDICLMAYAEYLGHFKDVSEDIIKAMMVDRYLKHSIKERGVSLGSDVALYHSEPK